VPSTRHAQLIDFGNSSTLASCRTLMIGTPDYMAPEMVAETYDPSGGPRPMAEEKYDAKAVDVWSMGALLYIITLGGFPFEDHSRPSNMAATLVKVQRGHYNRPPLTASLELCDLLACMFKVTPAKRIKLDQMRQHPWLCMPEEKLVQLTAVEAPTPMPAPPPKSSPKASHAAAATVQAMEAAQVGSPRKSEAVQSPRSALGFLTLGLRGMAVSPPSSSPSSPRSSASSAGDALPGAARKRPAWLHLP
jgi:serine/threonine protein kinase